MSCAPGLPEKSRPVFVDNAAMPVQESPTPVPGGERITREGKGEGILIPRRF